MWKSELEVSGHGQISAPVQPAAPGGAAVPVTFASISRMLQVQRRSVALAALLHNFTKKGSVELMTALAKMLADDAKRAEPLIDLNHKLVGGGTLLTLLIETLANHTLIPADGCEAGKQDKGDANTIFLVQMPHVVKLARGVDMMLLSKDGETALALLSRLAVPYGPLSWTYQLVETFLQAGSNPDARDKDGWTPLHHWAHDSTSSACGPLLLLRHGAAIDAQTGSDGSTCLHLLVHSVRIHEKRMLPALRELADSGYLALADYTLLNIRGQTALHMAQRTYNAAAFDLLEILHQQILWKTCAWLSGMPAAQARCSICVSMLLRNQFRRGSFELMHALAQKLAEDAERPEPLINLSLKLPGGGTLLTQLIGTLTDHTAIPSGASEIVQQRRLKADGIIAAHLPHVLKLVRSYDARLLSKDAETALSLLCRFVVPHGINSWAFRMAEALLQAGVNVESFDKDGWLPLQRWAHTATESACGPLLLLRHGANIDNQDPDGATFLHILVDSARYRRQKMIPALHQLADSGSLAVADLTLLNNAGDTALELAEHLVAQRPTDLAALELLHTLRAQPALWLERIRPAALTLLSEASLPLDLAEIVLGYVDGTQRPSEKQDAAALKQSAEASSASGASAAAASSS